MTNHLTHEQYERTLSSAMLNVTKSTGPVLNIWPYVDQLVAARIVHPHVYRQQLIEAVYRNPARDIDHVLLPTSDPQVFNVIVVDLGRKTIIGHYLQDLTRAAS